MRIKLIRSIIWLAALLGTTPMAAGSNWQLSAGIATQTAPLYQGSAEQELYLLPAIAAVYPLADGGRWYAGTVEGLGAEANWQPLTVGVAVGYRNGLRGAEKFGLLQDQPAMLDGLLDPGGTAILKPYISTLWPHWNARLEYERGLAQDNQGALLRLQLSYSQAPSQRFGWNTGLQASWADKHYMDDYFGVSAAEVRPDRSAYQGQAGLLQFGIFAQLQVQSQPQQRWLLSVALHQLADELDGSALVQQQRQAELTLAYLWLF